MRFLTFLAFLYLFNVNFSFSQVANFDWGVSIKSVWFENFESIVVDDEGNVFAVGYFSGIVDFDPGPGVYEIESEYPYESAFILKLNSSGEFQWCKAISTTFFNNIRSYAIALDSENNLIITGHFTGTVDFDPGIGEHFVTTTLHSQVYLLKLNHEGEFVWLTTFDKDYFARAFTLEIDEDDNFYITGDFADWMDADPGPEEYLIEIDEDFLQGLFIIKLDSEANFIWAGSIGVESTSDNIYDLRVDDSGNVIIGGVFRETIDFDPGIGVYEFTANSYENSFILKLNSEGNFVWVKKIDGVGASMKGLDLDSDGSIYTVGDFKSADFDPGIDEYYFEAIGESNGFIQKLSADGNFIYAKHFDTDSLGSSTVWDVFVNEAGEPFLVGWFGGNIDLDPGPEIHEFNSTSQVDAFIVSLSVGGNFQWAEQIRGVNTQLLTDLYVDSAEKVYVMGELRGDTDFGSELDEFYLDYSGFSQADAFIIKLSGCSTSGATNHILTCDSSYTWINGITYTESNYVETYSYETDGICDSVVTLSLTFAHLDNDVNVTGITLNSVVPGVNYQWLDCDNDYVEIEGEVGMSFTATMDGNYCVRIQQGECVDTSDCKTIAGVGIPNPPESLELKIFPNPSNGVINIHLNEISAGSLLRVYSSNGALIEEIMEVESYDQFKFQLSAGTYFIHYVSDEISRMFQFVVL